MFFLPRLEVNAILSVLTDHWHKLNMAYPLWVCPDVRILSWTTSKSYGSVLFRIHSNRGFGPLLIDLIFESSLLYVSHIRRRWRSPFILLNEKGESHRRRITKQS